VLVLLALRTRRPMFASPPAALLLATTCAVLVVVPLLVQSEAGRWLGFEPLSPLVLLVLAGVTLAYVATVEMTKRALYRMTDATR
jgi:Mg2+-importing ATPase